jgi:hypothetical protein
MSFDGGHILFNFYLANANYELGRGDNHARCKPTLIPEIESLDILQVACGGYHSAVLTGSVFPSFQFNQQLIYYQNNHTYC